MQNITTWPGWQTVRKIGSGSFGTVYEIQREDFGHTYKAALKVISIPQNESDIQRVKATGMNEESVTSYFRGFVEDFVQEIKLMDNLKGDSNIVSYEDHMVIPFDEGVGWNILIRMELLKPVLQHFEETRPMEEDIIRMGIDLCRALEKCSLYGIIHRDIKPENIFVNDRGDYKLGDFGVARTAERTASGMSVKGTYSYMAPEVYKEQPYDAAVDIYSLGIVLYQYLNNGRGPFLPAYPEDIRYADEQKALSERMSGRQIPAPVNGSRELKEAVLKAAAYDPAERYGSARELRDSQTPRAETFILA